MSNTARIWFGEVNSVESRDPARPVQTSSSCRYVKVPHYPTSQQTPMYKPGASSLQTAKSISQYIVPGGLMTIPHCGVNEASYLSAVGVSAVGRNRNLIVGGPKGNLGSAVCGYGFTVERNSASGGTAVTVANGTTPSSDVGTALLVTPYSYTDGRRGGGPFPVVASTSGLGDTDVPTSEVCGVWFKPSTGAVHINQPGLYQFTLWVYDGTNIVNQGGFLTLGVTRGTTSANTRVVGNSVPMNHAGGATYMSFSCVYVHPDTTERQYFARAWNSDSDDVSLARVEMSVNKIAPYDPAPAATST